MPYLCGSNPPKDLYGQKSRKLTDPTTWLNPEVTPEASEDLKGIDKRRSDAKAKGSPDPSGWTRIKGVEERIAAERMQRMAMQEQLVESRVGRVEEMGLLPKQQISKGQQQTDLQKNSPNGETRGGTSVVSTVLPPSKCETPASAV